MQTKISVPYRELVTKHREVTLEAESLIPKWCASDKTCYICLWGLNEGNEDDKYVVAMKTSDGVYYRHMCCDIPTDQT